MSCQLDLSIDEVAVARHAVARSDIQTLRARKPRVCWKPYSLNHGGPPTPA